MEWEGSQNLEGEAVGLNTGPGTTSSGPRTSKTLIWGILFAVCIVIVMGNRKLRFLLKYNAFSGIYFLFGIVAIPIMLFNPCDPKSTKFPQWLVLNIQGPLFGVSCKMRGTERYPDGPFILVCNHQSSLDCIGLMELWPQRCVIIMKKLLKYSGPFGLAAILAGTIFVDRSNNRNAKETLQNAVEIIQRKGYRILVFPEGTRRLQLSKEQSSEAEPMLPFKKGAFNLAILAQVPIVPVVFSSQQHLVDFNEYKFVSGEYTGTVLPPISTEGLDLHDALELSDKVRNIMIDSFNNIERENK